MRFLGPILLGTLASWAGLQTAILVVAAVSAGFAVVLPLLFPALAPPVSWDLAPEPAG